jgi:AraC-like DNA-binding protein
MYGFAILSSANFRQTADFAVKYSQLAAPVTEISFREEGKFGIWQIVPESHRLIDAALYRFIVELEVGTAISLHRDVMEPSFAPIELHFTFERPDSAKKGKQIFGCPALYGQPKNKIVFDAKWLNEKPRLGNAITFAQALQLCNTLLQQLRLSGGESGKVRKIYLASMGRPITFDTIAKRLNTSTRTLRRRLRQEGTSFRHLIDELNSQVAIKYVRETGLTVEEIAFAMGYGDAAAFRRTFRRWTGRAPHEFRRAAIDF